MNDYDGYNFAKFKDLAKDKNLSVYEKIGFHVSYRKNSEHLILDDLLSKIPNLKNKQHLNVLDIGPGCSNLQKYISSVCEENGHTLFLADCQEMLDLIENKNFTKKYAGFFPDTFSDIKKDSNGIDIIICYSTFQYIFAESNMWNFIDSIVNLMNVGAQALIGDIPNISKRKRFFASETGKKYHEDFMQIKEDPQVFLIALNLVE